MSYSDKSEYFSGEWYKAPNSPADDDLGYPNDDWEIEESREHRLNDEEITVYVPSDEDRVSDDEFIAASPNSIVNLIDNT